MMKEKNLVLICLVVLSGVFTVQLLNVPQASAQLFKDATSEACKGTQLSGATSGSAADCVPSERQRIDNTIKTAVNLLSLIVAIAAVVVIIVNGFRFVVSGGDSNSVGNAKKGIIYAVVGLIVVALAQFIVRFVLSRVS